MGRTADLSRREANEARSSVISSHLRSAMRMLLVQVPLWAIACGSLGPDGETYTLLTVNGDTLPAPFAVLGESPPVFETTSGSLTLTSDSTLVFTFEGRCLDNLPPDRGCVMVGDGREQQEGVYSRSQGWVRFTEMRWPAVFGTDSVIIHYNYTPNGSTPARSRLNFRR